MIWSKREKLYCPHSSPKQVSLLSTLLVYRHCWRAPLRRQGSHSKALSQGNRFMLNKRTQARASHFQPFPRPEWDLRERCSQKVALTVREHGDLLKWEVFLPVATKPVKLDQMEQDFSKMFAVLLRYNWHTWNQILISLLPLTSCDLDQSLNWSKLEFLHL